MSGIRRRITDVILETTGQTRGQHDFMGRGNVVVQAGNIQLAIRPRGLVGMVGFSEKRDYPLAEVSGWDVKGSRVEFTAGSIGMFATNGATMPVRICGFTCENSEAAIQLSEEAIRQGLGSAKVRRR